MSRRIAPERGFSLMELLVVMAILGIILTSIAYVFNRAVGAARTQTDMASMQQAQRIAHQEIGHFLRMAGVGGLPMSWTNNPGLPGLDNDTFGSFPQNGFAVAIHNNVEEGENPPFPLDNVTHPVTGESIFVIPGSDILTVRGSFSAPVFYLSQNLDLAAAISAVPDIPPTVVEVADRVHNLYSTPIDPLKRAIDETGADPVAVILRDLANPGAYFVAELDKGDADTDLDPDECELRGTVPATAGWADDDIYEAECIQLVIKLRAAGQSTSEAFGNLSQGTSLEADAGSLQIALPNSAVRNTLQVPREVGSIGVLEEYRFYLRADREIPGDDTSRLRPVLTRTQFVPGTNIALETIDIVEGLIDLQFAVGVDIQTTIGEAGGGQVTETETGTVEGTLIDEVLFNHPDDLDDSNVTNLPGSLPWYSPTIDYYFIRISTLAQTETPVRDRWSHQLEFLEDHDLRGTFNVDGKTESFQDDGNFPRSFMRSVIELRNIR